MMHPVYYMTGEFAVFPKGESWHFCSLYPLPVYMSQCVYVFWLVESGGVITGVRSHKWH